MHHATRNATRNATRHSTQVLWPVERAWYSGLVQAYNASEGKHFLLYSDGDVEWLALHSGYYAWQARPCLVAPLHGRGEAVA